MSKGSKRRPMNISSDEYSDRYDRAFHRKDRCPMCDRELPQSTTICHRCASEVLARAKREDQELNG